MIKTLDTFAGIGGFSLAGEILNHRFKKRIFQTVGFVEWEKYCQEEILKQNFEGVPVYGDIREVSARTFPDGVDLITGGFPCQDLSIAGARRGISGERSGLYFELIRLFDEFTTLQIRPPVLLLENVANLLTGDGGTWARIVFGELAERGLNTEWQVLSAGSMGAPHLRERVFIVSFVDRDSYGSNVSKVKEIPGKCKAPNSGGTCQRELPDSTRVLGNGGELHSEKRLESEEGLFSKFRNQNNERALPDSDELNGNDWGLGTSEIFRERQTTPKLQRSKPKPERPTQSELGSLVNGLPARLVAGQVWDHEPEGVPRVAHGVKGRVAALKAIGNAIVPEVATIPLMRVAEILGEI